MPISVLKLQEEARLIAAKKKRESFTASNGWLEKNEKFYNLIILHNVK